jgi:hypothetical protein
MTTTIAQQVSNLLELDSGHAVRWVDVHPDYSTRSEPDEIQSALDAAAVR